MSKKKSLDPLKLVKRLTEAGFSQEQAEIQVEIVTEIILTYQITTHDLNILYLKIILTMGGMMATSAAVIIGIMAELTG